VDAKVRELALISMVACFALALAWAYKWISSRSVLLPLQLLESSKQFEGLCELQIHATGLLAPKRGVLAGWGLSGS
jgi:hypothetical protein